NVLIRGVLAHGVVLGRNRCITMWSFGPPQLCQLGPERLLQQRRIHNGTQTAILSQELPEHRMRCHPYCGPESYWVAMWTGRQCELRQLGPERHLHHVHSGAETAILCRNLLRRCHNY
ncbi:hypothetical protein PENTCL1PPCAC_29040, partial [Pristionchus entomophagus]